MEILEQSAVPPAYSPGYAAPGPGIAGVTSAARPRRSKSCSTGLSVTMVATACSATTWPAPQLNELYAEVCGSYKFPNTTRTAPNVLKPLFDATGLIDNAASRHNVSYDTATGGLVSEPSAVAKVAVGRDVRVRVRVFSPEPNPNPNLYQVAVGREEFGEQVTRFLSSCALVSAGVVKASPTVSRRRGTRTV